MDILKILEGVVAKFAESVPGIIGALIITLVGWIIAKIVSKGILKVLEKLNIDQLADKVNDTDLVSGTNFKFQPSGLIANVVYFLIMLITLIAATDVLNVTAISNMMTDLMNYIPSLLIAIVLLILAVVVSDVIKKFVLAACNSVGIPSGRIISQFVFYLVFLTLSISALDQAKIATDLITSNLNIILAGIMAAFAIGYGLASKDTMANFLASYYSRNKIKLGDIIVFEKTKGKVIGMDTTSLSIKTETGTTIIPLKKLTSEKFEVLSK